MIVCYDEPFVGSSTVTQSAADVAYAALVKAGTIVPGDKRALDQSLIEIAMKALGSKKFDLAPAILAKLRQLYGEGNAVTVGLDFVDKVVDTANKLVGEEVCGPYLASLPLLDRASCFICMERAQEALPLLDEAIETHNLGVLPFLCRGRAFFLLGEFSRAFSDFGSYLASGNGFRRATAFAWSAESLLSMGRAAEAIGSLEDAVGVLADLPRIPPIWADVIGFPGAECLFGYGYGGPTEEGSNKSRWPQLDIYTLIKVVAKVDGYTLLSAQEKNRLEKVKAGIVRFRNDIGL